MYPSQSKLQIISKSKMQPLLMYDVSSLSSPKVPHLISAVEMSSKLQDEEGMSSNYEMKKYKR